MYYPYPKIRTILKFRPTLLSLQNLFRNDRYVLISCSCFVFPSLCFLCLKFHIFAATSFVDSISTRHYHHLIFNHSVHDSILQAILRHQDLSILFPNRYLWQTIRKTFILFLCLKWSFTAKRNSEKFKDIKPVINFMSVIMNLMCVRCHEFDVCCHHESDIWLNVRFISCAVSSGCWLVSSLPCF